MRLMRHVISFHILLALVMSLMPATVATAQDGGGGAVCEEAFAALQNYFSGNGSQESVEAAVERCEAELSEDAELSGATPSESAFGQDPPVSVPPRQDPPLRALAQQTVSNPGAPTMVHHWEFRRVYREQFGTVCGGKSMPTVTTAMWLNDPRQLYRCSGGQWELIQMIPDRPSDGLRSVTWTSLETGGQVEVDTEMVYVDQVCEVHQFGTHPDFDGVDDDGNEGRWVGDNDYEGEYNREFSRPNPDYDETKCAKARAAVEAARQAAREAAEAAALENQRAQRLAAWEQNPPDPFCKVEVVAPDPGTTATEDPFPDIFELVQYVPIYTQEMALRTGIDAGGYERKSLGSFTDMDVLREFQGGIDCSVVEQ